MAEFYRKKKKVCQLCAGREVNYKDVETIRKYVDREKYKILPRRVTGTCAKHQRIKPTYFFIVRGKVLSVIQN